MFDHLPDILIHKITTYLGYCDVFMCIKYINRNIKFNIFNNIKFNKRQQYIYYKIILQQLYHKNRYYNYKFSPNTSFENYCNKLFRYIDPNILSTRQKISFIKIKDIYYKLINQ
jgi:hypothetical protein